MSKDQNRSGFTGDMATEFHRFGLRYSYSVPSTGALRALVSSDEIEVRDAFISTVNAPL